MNDEDLEIRLRDHYRSIDPRVAPPGLGAQIDGVMDRSSGRRVAVLRMPAFAIGLAAVAIATVLAVTLVPGVLPGPAAPSPSASPAGSPATSPSPAGSPAVTPLPSLPGGTMPPISTATWSTLDVQPLLDGPPMGQLPGQLVAWSGGYLALGDPQSPRWFGLIASSVAAWVSGDGRSWAPVPGNPFGEVTSIVAAPIADGVLVLATATGGTGLAWRSRDGLTWTPVPAPALRNLDPGYVAGNDSGVVVAVEGQPASVAQSTDGTSWQTVTMPGGDHAQVTGVAASSDGFVAVGHVFASPDAPIAWWSPDGITWSLAQVADRPGESFVAVHGGATGAIAFSGPGPALPGPPSTPGSATYWMSADGGRSWDPADDPLGDWQQGEGAANPNGLFWGDGTRLLGWGVTEPGQSTGYWTSTDATTWTRLELTGDTAAAARAPDLQSRGLQQEGQALEPYLLRDGALFAGPDGDWIGSLPN